MNEITIVFNEPLNVDHGEDPMNYEVMDTDYTIADVTDALTITNIRVDGAAVILTTSGMTDQFEERYEVVLRGITDTNGNAITPNPRTVTVVLRNFPEVEPEEENLEETDESANTETTEEIPNE